MYTVDEIIGICKTTAIEMGLDPLEFESNLRSNFDLYTDNRRVEKIDKPRTYTIRFLQKFSEKCTQELFDSNAETRVPAPMRGPLSKSSSAVPNHNGPPYKKNISNETIFFSPKRDPPPPVVRSENAWIGAKFGKEHTEFDMNINKIRSDLNKISIENGDSLSTRICDNTTDEYLETVNTLIFQKAEREIKFHSIYANLCVMLNSKFREKFMELLLKQCKEGLTLKLSDDDEDETIILAVKNRLGAISFIIELLKKKIVNPKSVLECMEILSESINDSGMFREHNICHTCEMLILTVPEIKTVSMLKKFIPFFNRLIKIDSVSTRTKFKIEEVLAIGNRYKLL